MRAKRKPYIPVALSRDEIQAALQHLAPPCDLVVKLLYGCGLRHFESLKTLHQQDLNRGYAGVFPGHLGQQFFIGVVEIRCFRVNGRGPEKREVEKCAFQIS